MPNGPIFFKYTLYIIGTHPLEVNEYRGISSLSSQKKSPKDGFLKTREGAGHVDNFFIFVYNYFEPVNKKNACRYIVVIHTLCITC